MVTILLVTWINWGGAVDSYQVAMADDAACAIATTKLEKQAQEINIAFGSNRVHVSATCINGR